MNARLELSKKLIDLGHLSQERLKELEETFKELAPQTPLDAQLLIAQEIDELSLLQAMQEAYKLPYLDSAITEGVNKKSALIFPRDLAQKYKVAPYDSSNGELLLLTAEPLDEESIHKISQRTKLRLQYRITTSIQIAHLLKKLYAVPLPAYASQIALDTSYWKQKRRNNPPPRAESPKRNVSNPPKMDSIFQRIETSLDKDEIFNLILAAAQNHFSFVSFFRLRNNRIIGWRTLDPALERSLQQINLSLHSPSVFQTIRDTGGHYLGPLSPAENHATLLEMLNLPKSTQALGLPLRIGKQISVILFCAEQSKPIDANWVAPFVDLTSRACWSLERVLRQQKRESSSNSVSIPAPIMRKTKVFLSADEVTPELESKPKQAKPARLITKMPPSVRWENVISQAQNAIKLEPGAPSNPIEIGNTQIDVLRLLYADLHSTDSGIRKEAAEKLSKLRPALDELLKDEFPGRITQSPLSAPQDVPPLKQCSRLLEYLESIGASASPIVLPHLENPKPIPRFFALYFLHAVQIPQGLEACSRRLYDSEPAIRYMAAETIRQYNSHPDYTKLIDGLLRQITLPIHEIQITTIQVMGQLREKRAVPSLIPLLNSPHSPMVIAAASALAVICAQELGKNVKGWTTWWQQHSQKPRTAWLIKGLRHSNSMIRTIAHSELELITSFKNEYEPDASKQLREAPTRQWEAWWENYQNDSPNLVEV